jgi:hypothetical protein
MYKMYVRVPLFLLALAAPAIAQTPTQNSAQASPQTSSQTSPQSSGQTSAQPDGTAQLPNRPEVRVKGQPKIQANLSAETQASPHPHKIADKKFWILAGLQVGATIADFETTQWAERVRPDGGEVNPVYGSHPGRMRMYGIGMSLTGVQILLQCKSKGMSQRNGKMKKAWIVGALLNTGVHTFLAVHNGRIAGQGACGVGDACQ